MASTIQIKRGTGSAVPSGLADGELAINLDSGKLYFGSGSTSVNDFTFGEITAEKYIVSSSVLYVTTSFSSGSTEFGNSADDTHTFTGNITASGNIEIGEDASITSKGDITLHLDKDDNDAGGGRFFIKDGSTQLLQLDQYGTFILSGSFFSSPSIILHNTSDTDTAFPKLDFKRSIENGAGVTIGEIDFDAADSAGNLTGYGKIIGTTKVTTSGQEGGLIKFQVASHDAELVDGLIIEDGDAEDEIDVTIASGINSLTTVAGNLDVDGTANLDAVDIDGDVQLDGTLTIGSSGTGYDLLLFGDTHGKFLRWDESEDLLDIRSETNFGVDDTGVVVQFFGNTSGKKMQWDGTYDLLNFTDNTKLTFGTPQVGGGFDASIYADGSDLYITNSPGVIKIGDTVEVTGQITASGNISSSGGIYGNTLLINNYNAANSTGTTLRLGYDSTLTALTYGKDSDTSHFFYGTAITASGNISASGNIYGGIYYTNDQRSLYNIGGTLNVGDGVGSVTVPQLTASGDISSSGNFDLTGNANIDGNLDVDGTTNLDAVDIDGNVQLDGTFTVGVDDTGYDVTLFGATANRKAVWDASADHLKLYDNTKLGLGTGVAEAAFDASLYHDGTDLNLTNSTGEFKITTDTVRITAGTAGDANLILQADSDNNDEADNPFMTFEQDGGAIRSIIGHTGADNEYPDATTFTGGKGNHLIIAHSGSGASRGIQFGTGNNARVTIDTDGNVGIGNNAPGKTLDVTGEIRASGNITANGNIVGDGATQITGIDVLKGTTDDILDIKSDSDIIYTADDDGDEVGQHIFKDRTVTLLTLDETQATFTSPITASSAISSSGTVTADRFVGSQLTMVPFNYFVSSVHSSELYVPQGGSQIESTSDQPYHFMLAPYDGKVRRVSVYYQSGDPGTLTARVRAAAAPFDLDDADDIVQELTQTSVVDDTAYFFDFDASFSKGEAVALTFEAASHGSNSYVVGCMAVEYDTTT